MTNGGGKKRQKTFGGQTFRQLDGNVESIEREKGP